MLPELEEKCMHLAQEAKKIMRHCKRKVLKPSDIDAALKEIDKSDVSNIFGTYQNEYERYVQEDSTSWRLKNEDINLKDFVSKPIIEAPLKTTIQMHWALLNGEIPLVPENILPPKEKLELKKKESDPLTKFLKKAEPVAPKKKIKMEHKKEIPISQEVKEFYMKFLEMYNIEENDNKHSVEMRVSKAITHDFWAYVELIKTEPSVVPIIPAILDLIFHK
jgi:hypothetical protein